MRNLEQTIAEPGARGIAHPVPPPSGEYRWVYLWQWPIRAMHWIAVACILTLAVTGFYIGRPYFFPSGAATEHYMMGWVRLIHFSAAGVLVATAILRFYWLFAGNKFERWRALFPVHGQDWKNLVKMARYYLLIDHEEPHYLGHNPLQQLSYTGIYLLAAIMVVTGFAMYGQSNPAGLFFHLFNWVGALFGGMQVVRFVHHVLTWVFLIFIPVHVYLALRAEVVERTGTISSIISGGRFVPEDREYADD